MKNVVLTKLILISERDKKKCKVLNIIHVCASKMKLSMAIYNVAILTINHKMNDLKRSYDCNYNTQPFLTKTRSMYDRMTGKIQSLPLMALW